MSEILRDLFMLSKRERNGVLILIVLIVVTQIARYSLSCFIHPPGPEPLSVYYKKFITDTSRTDAKYTDYDDAIEQSQGTTQVNPEPFDPNKLDEEGWRNLGFSDKQIAGILKFKEKNGGFKSKADLKKLYAMSKEMYARIEPFVLLPDTHEYASHADYAHNTNPDPQAKAQALRISSPVIELNSADTTELKKIRGFGSFTAKKIVAYRERLGGFRDVSQLLEVWPIRPGLLDSVQTNIRLDTSLTEKMNINTVDLERLRKHPYITTGQAKALIAFRDKHGSFREITDIKKCVLIDEVTFARLKPYLTR